jgi:inhibitor of cysteine peptidase
MRSATIRLVLTAALLTALSGCSLAGPDTYELGEKDIHVELDEEFTLTVPVDVPMGEHWYMTVPKPDASVVRPAGQREELEGGGENVGGGSGTNFFDFKAVGRGTTTIRLLQCPNGACSGGGSESGPVTPSPVPSGSPTPQAKYRATVHTYKVTVK